MKFLTFHTCAAQVETLLKTQDPMDANLPVMDQTPVSDVPYFDIASNIHSQSGTSNFGFHMPKAVSPSGMSIPDAGSLGFQDVMNDTPLSWEMIQMGLDEPLPDQIVIDDL